LDPETVEQREQRMRAATSTEKTPIDTDPRNEPAGNQGKSGEAAASEGGKALHSFVLGFYTEDEPGVGQKGSFHTMIEQAERIDAVAPFWFQLSPQADGSVRRFDVSQARIRTVIQEAHSHGLEVYALLHNLLYGEAGKGRRVAETVLNDPSRRGVLVEQTVGLAVGYGFDGVNIDLEYIGPNAGDGYIAYLRELRAEFDKHDLKLTVAIPPKTAAQHASNWSAGYDYEAIAKYSDLVAIMTYQAHGPGTEPGPIAPIGWIEDVVRYALTVIPEEKLLVGVGAYGFDWRDDGSRQARYLGYHQALAQARKDGAQSGYSDEHQAPWVRYTDQDGTPHELWYDDARSTLAKLDLYGASAWRTQQCGRLSGAKGHAWSVRNPQGVGDPAVNPAVAAECQTETDP